MFGVEMKGTLERKSSGSSWRVPGAPRGLGAQRADLDGKKGSL